MIEKGAIAPFFLPSEWVPVLGNIR
jgi:hypothetical protein